MIKYLIVLLDARASSFCYYSNERASDKNNLIDYEVLSEIIDYAEEKQLAINFLYSDNPLPKKYNDLIESVNHIKYIPAAKSKKIDSGIIILNSGSSLIDSLEYDPNNNVILRLKKSDLLNLSNIINTLIPKVKRINLSVLDMIDYSHDDISSYQTQLDKIIETVVIQYKKGNSVELNFLSDRLLLDNMNNCNAGIDHITVAPNGKFYICPGFYYDDENDIIGDIKTGINIKNIQLLNIEHSSICSICDAYQCKRCVWMNKNITLEINTPSFQHCALSHMEREASRRLLEILKNEPGFKDFDNLVPIPEVDYIDPLKALKGGAKSGKQLLHEINNSSPYQIHPAMQDSQPQQYFKKNQFDIQNKIPEDLSLKELSIEIYKMQKNILKEFDINESKSNVKNK